MKIEQFDISIDHVGVAFNRQLTAYKETTELNTGSYYFTPMVLKGKYYEQISHIGNSVVIKNTWYNILLIKLIKAILRRIANRTKYNRNLMITEAKANFEKFENIKEVIIH